MGTCNHSEHDHNHDHHHHHGHHHHHHFGPNDNKSGLLIALCITAGIMLLEFIGGLYTNSLALLSDSGHMLSDTLSIVLSIAAIWLTARFHTEDGYSKFEIWAAFLNGLSLFVVVGIIIWEAYGRLLDPPTVTSGGMLIIAAIGLLANLLSAGALMMKSDVKNNINVRSAYLHILGDALGSVGAIIAGVIMMFTDWYIVDPILSVLVSLLILKGAWGILRYTTPMLMKK